MYSDSYLEIYLTAAAWDWYGSFVTFLRALNLHYAPFIYIMLKNWWDTRRSQDSGTAVLVEWRRNYFDVYTMMLVVILFWIPSPYTTFKASQHIQEIVAETKGIPTSQIYKEVEIAKSMKDSFSMAAPGEVPIPIGWYMLTYAAKGSINQLIESTQFTSKIKTLSQAYSSMKISDRELREETNAFYSSCYAPTLGKFQNETHQPIPVFDDPNEAAYIGNSIFINTPGYYKECTQAQEDGGQCYGSGFYMPYNVAERKGLQTIFEYTTSDGKQDYYQMTPSCYTWWTGKTDYNYPSYSEAGLKERLSDEGAKSVLSEAIASGANFSDPQFGPLSGFQAVSLSAISSYWTWAYSQAGSEHNKEDIIKKLLRNEPPSLIADKEAPDDRSWLQSGADWIQGLIGGIGAGIASFSMGVVLELLKPALIMIYSATLFGAIMYSSIILLFGGFSVASIVKIIFYIAGIMLLPLWWHIASIIDEMLLQIMYPGIDSALEMDASTSTFLYLILLLIFYVAIPTKFVKMMALVGKDAGEISSKALTDVRVSGEKGASKFN